MEYAYTALSSSGNRIDEILQAEDEDQALRRLQEQGMTILSLKARSRSSDRPSISSLFKFKIGRTRVKSEHVVSMTRELAIMIETGVPIIEALGLLAEHAENAVIRRAMVSTLHDVTQGKSITDAMSNHPRIFPKLYVAMIASAEVGGTLHTTLNQAADYLEASQELRRKVKGALTYPVILILAMLLVLVFMIVFLIPRFSSLFSHMNVPIPPTLQFMIDMSSFVRHQWWMLPFIIGGVIFGFKALIRNRKGNMYITKHLMRIPVLGDTIHKIAVARILRAMATLIDTGVALLLSLETIIPLAQNIVYEDAIAAMRTQVETGSSLTEALKATSVFPPIVCQMVAVGEKSGRLTIVLMHIAQYYEREIDARLKALASIIEPVMIVILGFMVGFIALSIFSPLYSIYDNIK